jgi:hypothetical protein
MTKAQLVAALHDSEIKRNREQTEHENRRLLVKSMATLLADSRGEGIEAAAEHVASFQLEIHAPNGDLVRCDLSALVESIRGLR